LGWAFASERNALNTRTFEGGLVRISSVEKAWKALGPPVLLNSPLKLTLEVGWEHRELRPKKSSRSNKIGFSHDQGLLLSSSAPFPVSIFDVAMAQTSF
jgi:hypothetical protein